MQKGRSVQKHLARFRLNEYFSIIRVTALHSVMHLLLGLLLTLTQPNGSWTENTAWYCVWEVSRVVSQHSWSESWPFLEEEGFQSQNLWLQPF